MVLVANQLELFDFIDHLEMHSLDSWIFQLSFSFICLLLCCYTAITTKKIWKHLWGSTQRGPIRVTVGSRGLWRS